MAEGSPRDDDRRRPAAGACATASGHARTADGAADVRTVAVLSGALGYSAVLCLARFRRRDARRRAVHRSASQSARAPVCARVRSARRRHGVAGGARTRADVRRERHEGRWRIRIREDQVISEEIMNMRKYISALGLTSGLLLATAVPASAQSLFIATGERAVEVNGGWSVGSPSSEGAEGQVGISLDGRWDVGIGFGRYTYDFDDGSDVTFNEYGPFVRYFFVKEKDGAPLSVSAGAQLFFADYPAAGDK